MDVFMFVHVIKQVNDGARDAVYKDNTEDAEMFRVNE